MSFCSKCGNQLLDNAKFCPKCGASVAGRTVSPVPEKDPSQGGFTSSAASQNGAGVGSLGAALGANTDQAFAIVGALLILFTFMPWLQAGLFGISLSYSLVGLPGALGQLQSLANTNAYLYTVANSEVFQYISLVVWALFACWAIAAGSLAVNAIRAFMGKSTSAVPFLVVGIFALAIIIALFIADGYVSSQVAAAMGSYGNGFTTTGMISATPWAWVSAILGIAAFFVYRSLRKTS